ncbi:MAG: GFA family protein [Myxococcales bacterium]|nr:GFA family protein [Myxococcales bacterium]
MTRQGSCHCGAIRYTVDTELEQVMRCNCSICGRTGTLMTFVPEAAFTLVQGAEHYRDYQFGKKSTHHGFCDVCGVRPYGSGEGEHGSMVMINVGCLQGVDVRDHADAAVFDGASL